MGEEHSTANHSIILFDGVCNLCNASVQFIIKRDPRAQFKFASLQSEVGMSLLQKYNLPAHSLRSILLIMDNKVYDRSSAALHIARKLNGPWPWMYGFIVVPPFIRDFIYNWVAHNRYSWFGKREECMIPTPDIQSRFIR